MKRLTIFASAILVACASGLNAAEPKTAPVTRLAAAPANTWVRVTDLQTGVRQNSAFFYSDAIERGLVWCMSGGRQTYVLRVDPKALKLSNDPAN